MKRTLIAAHIVLAVCSTILRAEDGPAKKEERAEDVVAKEKVAKEWLKYMEGEWKVVLHPIKSGGQLETYDATSYFIGDVLVSEISSNRLWESPVHVTFWDQHKAQLTRHMVTVTTAQSVPFHTESEREQFLKVVAKHKETQAKPHLLNLSSIRKQELRGDFDSKAAVRVSRGDPEFLARIGTKEPRRFNVLTLGQKSVVVY